jgi:hypothetical protein
MELDVEDMVLAFVRNQVGDHELVQQPTTSAMSNGKLPCHAQGREISRRVNLHAQRFAERRYGSIPKPNFALHFKSPN